MALSSVKAVLLCMGLLLWSTCRAQNYVPENQFCINNHVYKSATALSSNLSIGLQVLRKGEVIYPKKGGIYHLHWGKKYCRTVNLNEDIVLYETHPFQDWHKKASFETRHLKGMEVRIGRAGRTDKVYGLNYLYYPRLIDALPSSSRWMTALYSDSDIPLNQICMPGTHGSGTYKIGVASREDPHMDGPVRDILDKLKFPLLNIPVKKVVAVWAKSQNLSVYGQLKAGARYIDLRARKIKGELVTVHQLQGATLVTIVDDLRRFLDENPGEVVILHFNEAHGMTKAERKEMYNLLESQLGTRIASEELKPRSSLKDFQNAGKQLIIVARDDRDDPLVWDWHDNLSNLWFDQNQPDELLRSLAGNIPFRRNDQFYVSQMILTPRDADIEKMAVPGLPSSIDQLVDTLRYSSGMMKYLMNAAEKRNKRVNIILQDFIEQSDIYRACMAENMEQLAGE